MIDEDKKRLFNTYTGMKRRCYEELEELKKELEDFELTIVPRGLQHEN